MSEEMNAVRIHEFGGPDVLQYETAPQPEPAADEVLVRVHAAGVNRVDTAVREGNFGEIPFPWIPGWDLSGTVEAVGADVTEFEEDSAVYGLVGFPEPGNADAEYAAVPADEIVEKPETLDHTEAAGVPMVALTAWQALFDKGELSEDQRVLIHAAAGGVGHIAVQLAKSQGAHVIGTASGYNELFLRDLGADEFVNYRETSFEEELDDIDLVVDAIGGDTREHSYEVLTEGGILAALVGEISDEQAEEYSVHARRVGVRPDAAILSEISELIDAGEVEPTISTTLPLADAPEAHEQIEEGHTRGKIVLHTGD
ncbi:NADP-dependent oxidoreductase [Halococcus salifodinae]|uniref:Zn-dependent oxidoreductase, NADPH:quinone reductase n=1 Tax=Halococcus salifodinae DSM 8989 TaxID=1227456 RepID=M0N1F4_9EURY|nr:Zn-dependent oxidoreductase, NADPH:quinone reductase [Halococcus salifodinae DSM 8989]